MPNIVDAPWLYLGLIALHLLLGQFGSALVYRWRFGGSPLVLYRPGQRTRHMALTRAIGGVSLLWFGSIFAYTFSPLFRESWLGRPLFHVDPAWGFGLALLCLAGMLGSQAAMGRSFRVGQDETGDPELVSSGLYRYSRNPVYVFSFFYLVGATLWAPGFLASASCAGLGWLMHGLVLAEEEFLARQLGASYREYRRRVPRYAPLPGWRRWDS
jgi:protein-S-isoprenylcysteine O-methyltransferase Ste14